MLTTDCLHCLTVDFAHAPEPVRTVLTPGADELRDFLCDAGRASLELLVLSSQDALSLVSTRQDHVRAFRPVLAVIREGMLGIKGWRTLRVRVASGSDAARQLLRQGMPESPALPEVAAFLGDLRAAADLSSACGALGSELSGLVRLVEHAAHRIGEETRLGSPSRAAQIELESPVAERILEEELARWQSTYPALRSSQRPVSDADIGSFDGAERQTRVRTGAPSAPTNLRTA